MLVLFLYTLLHVQTVTIPIYNPSSSTYKYLQQLYLNALKCPCSNVTMSYSTVMTLSATLHQVCQSDFVDESWISMITIVSSGSNKYDGLDDRHFRLLSTLCQLINKTIDDTTHRFMQRSLVTANVLPESSLITELNTTLNQTIQSLITNFNLLIDMSNLFNHVDQPFTMTGDPSAKVNVRFSNSPRQVPQVCYHDS